MLFVCSENICRSPLAEGLLRHHLRQAGRAAAVRVASAGTRASMRGARPDPRAEKLAAQEGVNLGRIRARRVTRKDFAESDHIFAMDQTHLDELRSISPPEHQHKITLLLSHCPGSQEQDVPDPYYGSTEHFRQVYLLIEEAVVSLLPLFNLPR